MLLLLVCFIHLLLEIRCMPIDELIANAAQTSEVFEFMHDENPGVLSKEMDMLFSTERWKEIQERNTTKSRRQALADTARIWEKGVVPYEIENFSVEEIIEVHKAFNQWAGYTCLLFRPSTPADVHKIIFKPGNGCQSYVGRYDKPQNLYLSKNCRKASVITHELGHGLGLFHEQSRPDRDLSVDINWDNIPPPQVDQFEKFPSTVIQDVGVPYDYLSIMHYGPKAFSANGKYTIVTKDPSFQSVIGNSDTVSFRDIKTISLLYNCGEACPGSCPGEGFHNKDCQCLCPGNPIQPCEEGGTEEGAGGKLPADYVPPTEETEKEDCKDANSQCVKWKDEGLCDSDYMKTYCKQACDLCECEDRNKVCSVWALHNECEKNPGYMLNYCKLSCGQCGQASKTNVCQDIRPEKCVKWNALNYCTSLVYDRYMKIHCKKSCDLCTAQSEQADTHNSIAHTPTICQDLDTNCSQWAKSGKCDETPKYMYRFCQKSCHVCD